MAWESGAPRQPHSAQLRTCGGTDVVSSVCQRLDTAHCCFHVRLLPAAWAVQVTWVGKSSMEVTLELWAHPAPPTPHPCNGDGLTADSAGTRTPATANGSGNAGAAAAEDVGGTCSSAAGALSEPHAVAVARFLMAARSRDLTSAALVPPLQLSGELDRARFDQGIRDNQARQDRCVRREDVRRTQGRGAMPCQAASLAYAHLQECLRG